MTAIFDGPELTTSCTRRTRSNVALQSLALLNDPMFVEAAQALAKRVLIAHDETDKRITFLFAISLSRAASSQERVIVQQLLAEQLVFFMEDDRAAVLAVGDYGLDEAESGINGQEQAAWVAVCRTIMNLDEFIMRE